MQKSNISCIKTGEFARLCNTNKRTLFHYDAIGLLKPAFTDKKGYRYYSESQCDVFFTITCLKELGMPLGEIRSYIEHRSPENLKELLTAQELRVQQELARLHQIRQVIRTKLELVETGLSLASGAGNGAVLLEENPEEYLAVSQELHAADRALIIQTLYEHIRRCACLGLNSGHPYGAMMRTEELRGGVEDAYAFFFTKLTHIPENHPCRIKAAGTYAVTYLKGDYYDARDAYERLFAFADSRGLSAGPFLYKEAVIDEIAAADPAEYLTKISLPVASARP